MKPAPPAPGATSPQSSTRVSMFTLATFVIGSMVGAGVFSLPANFATATGGAGALIAWAVAGGGMLMLALVFHRLAIRRPDLDAGIYSYAKAGFRPVKTVYVTDDQPGNTGYELVMLLTREDFRSRHNQDALEP